MISSIDVSKSAHETVDVLRAGIAQTQKNVDEAILVLGEYIETEKQRNAALAEKISLCNEVFEKMAESAGHILPGAKKLQNKLDSSCKALTVMENQEALLDDIHANFTGAFDGRSVEIQQQLQRILDRLSGISHTCSHFQTFPKPYKDIIDLYSVKIEQIFGILSAASATVVAKTQPAKKESDLIDNETNTAPEAQTMLPTDSDRYYISKDFQQSGPFGRDKLITMLNDGLVSYDFYVSLNGISDWKPIGDVVPAQAAMPETISDKKEVDSVWNRHYKTGIACAHLTPERAVVELTKAIQLNPNNAEQYYFRGIAYQKTNKFTAALQDFEKAHKLSPNTDKYSNALEKARKDNKQK